MRRLAGIGFTLVALMQLIFLLTGGDRAFPYQEVQALSLAGTIALVWGAWRQHDMALAGGFAVNLFTRVLQPLLGVTRLPLWSTAILVLGWTWALAQAARGRDARIGVWILGLAHFLAALTTFARLTSTIALGLGAVGLFLAAPNLRQAGKGGARAAEDGGRADADRPG